MELPDDAAATPLLEAVNLSKRYEDGVTALDDVCFAVAPGTVYAMLGGNGAGKTTTINLFLNFIEPTGGEARIAGFVSHREPLEAKRRVAYVSENVALYPQLTAYQNLDFFTRLAGGPDTGRESYRRVLMQVGLEPEAHGRRLVTFSKGMRQKCALAIAILKNAPAILLDEPTSGLDPKAGLELVRLLGELRNEGKAILMSTHDIFRAKQVADTIGIMDRGRLVMERCREELLGEDLETLYVRFIAGGNGPEVAEGAARCSA